MLQAMDAADLRTLVRDEAQLRAALEETAIASLLMVLVQLTGEVALLDEFRAYITGPADYAERAPADRKAYVRDQLVQTLKKYAHESRPLPPAPSDRLLKTMMSTCVGEPVPAEYIPMLLEEMGFTRRHADLPSGCAAVRRNFHVAVIGAGMSGICAGITLRRAGIPFTIFEKDDHVSGTWYENSYPGCRVDTPNHFYAYSFEPNHDWSTYFSKRDEIWQYFERCADKYKLRENIRLRTEVEAARYDEARHLWRLTVRNPDGSVDVADANAIICAVGQLNRPAIPRIRGIERFHGSVFHTARWDHSQCLAGRRVAMIGTGASAMQVGPSIAPEVEHLKVFQRSPQWIVWNPNYHRSVTEGKKWALRFVPYYASWYRFQCMWGYSDGLHAALQIDPNWTMRNVSCNATNERHRQYNLRHLKRELGDDEALIRKVTPDYPPYGKRMLIDNYWWRMLKRDNVELITEQIECATSDGIITRNGEAHHVDMIIWATGFQAGRVLWPMDIRGRSGRSVREIWGDDDARAYLGITVPDFPNLFIMYGPNTNLGHGGSQIFNAECQIRYIMGCLKHLIDEGHVEMEVRQEAHDAYNGRLDEALGHTVWVHPGVNNWYRNSRGRVVTNSPWRIIDYWDMTKEPKLDDYKIK